MEAKEVEKILKSLSILSKDIFNRIGEVIVLADDAIQAPDFGAYMDKRADFVEALTRLSKDIDSGVVAFPVSVGAITKKGNSTRRVNLAIENVTLKLRGTESNVNSDIFDILAIIIQEACKLCQETMFNDDFIKHRDTFSQQLVIFAKGIQDDFYKWPVKES